MSDDKVLIQEPTEPTPKIIKNVTFVEQWSGEVIRLSGPALRFDISWFIPEFTRHRRLLSEVLVFSLLLQKRIEQQFMFSAMAAFDAPDAIETAIVTDLSQQLQPVIASSWQPSSR